MVDKDFIKSGKILREAREYGKTLVKEGIKYLEIAEKIECKIRELGGKPAFPVDVSVNHIAAHDCPLYNDERVIKKGDVVKIDLGVHINGKVTDSACTVEVGTDEHKKLIEAAEEALKKAIEIVKPGVKLKEIGKIIQEIITGYGFSPIRNLSGHEVGEYEVHAGLTIPNYDNGDERELKKDMVVAIEPFATTGEGKIIEGKKAEVYAVINLKNVRDMFARKMLEFISEEYKTLPFCARWLIKKFGLRAKLALRNLEQAGVIKQYNQLPEIAKGIVSQAEHTLVVGGEVLS